MWRCQRLARFPGLSSSWPWSSRHTRHRMQAACANVSAADLHVYVRCPPHGTSMTISLVVGGKPRNMNRPKDEPLQKALARLRANVQPGSPRGKKARKKPGPRSAAHEPTITAEEPGIPVLLYADSAGARPIPDATPNAQAWVAAALLVVGDERFRVSVNMPFADKVVLPRRPLAGFPQLPAAVLEFADPSLSRWQWFRCRPGADAWELMAGIELYVPGQADVGMMLKAVCTPAASAGHGLQLGEPVEAISGVVEAAPVRHAALVRGPHTGAAAQAPAFRILSYNLLADQYASSTYAQQVLFNYCPPSALDADYRCQLIMAELAAYQADVMCLQEVDSKLFTEFLVPHLSRRGYAGHFTNKQGKVREGSATFWRTDRFARVLSLDIHLRDVFKQPLAPAHAQWQPMLDASPELVKALQKVTTVAQATVLMPVDAGGPAGLPPLCVINTHLFFHPYAPHIRTMHTAAILEEAAALLGQLAAADGGVVEPGDADGGSKDIALNAKDLTSQTAQAQVRRAAARLRGARPSLLFCGDLNSDLNDGVPGVVQLLQEGKLEADHWDWRMGASFRWGMNEEDGDAAQQAGAPQPPGSAIAAAVAAAKDKAGTAEAAASGSGGCAVSVVGIDVTAPVTLRSADALATSFTNYTSGYKALLDYVWYQPEDLGVAKAYPVPNEQELGSFIPSPSFPSDHLAVVFDLEPVPLQE